MNNCKKEHRTKIKSKNNWLSCILVNSIRKDNKKIAYIIGVCIKTNKKTEIIYKVTKNLKRIRRKYNNPYILIYGDMNTNIKDSIKKLEKMETPSKWIK